MIFSFAPRFGLLGLFVLISACQSFPDGERRLADETARSFQDSLAHSQAALQAPLPATRGAPVEPPVPAAPSAAVPRFDVLVSDMPARAFFLSLMDSAGQNILVPPQVSGEITLSLRQVTLPEVLAAVRDGYGYDFRRTSYGYQIQPNQAITRTYDLNYLNVQRQGMSDPRVSSGQVTTSDSIGAGAAGTTTSSTASTVSASHLLTSSNADFWKEVQAVVAMIIGAEEGNSVVVNPQAGLLVVRASSADQQSVADFLDKAQRNLQRQVILETKILEVSLTDEFQAGIRWSDLGRERNSRFGVALAGAELAGAQGIGGVFSAALSVGDFDGILQLLETQGDVRVLSSPRISTLNNQKAVIKVGTDEFFVTDVSTTTTTLAGGGTAPDLDITLTPFFSGISLDVTPQIDEREQVTLHVRPTVSRVQDQNKSIQLGSSSNTFLLPLALSTTRQSDSIVRARSGQVVVIGGLIENGADNTDAQVPWLGRLPGLGWLFKQQRKVSTQTELVILMRPLVVGDQTWHEVLQSSARSFDESGRR